jgi:hypothetical protein
VIPEFRKNLSDLASADFVGFDALVHLAALSNDPSGNLDSKLTFTSSITRLRSRTVSVNTITAYGESTVLVERDVTHLADDDFSPIYMRNATANHLRDQLLADCTPEMHTTRQPFLYQTDPV